MKAMVKSEEAVVCLVGCFFPRVSEKDIIGKSRCQKYTLLKQKTKSSFTYLVMREEASTVSGQ